MYTQILVIYSFLLDIKFSTQLIYNQTIIQETKKYKSKKKDTGKNCKCFGVIISIDNKIMNINSIDHKILYDPQI